MHRITGRVVAPTFQQMRLFEAVARHGSITRAAEEVNLTQPSVSMQVRALEEKLGQPLTEQIGKACSSPRPGKSRLPRAATSSTGWPR
ncbi:MAG: LysR family transcriptional regulator [Paracoccaceae bacterium]